MTGVQTCALPILIATVLLIGIMAMAFRKAGRRRSKKRSPGEGREDVRDGNAEHSKAGGPDGNAE